MPRSRTLPATPAAKACVIGLVVGTVLAPVLLSLLGRGETSVPPVGFVSVAVFCWGLVPRLFMEMLPMMGHRQPPPASAPAVPGAIAESTGDPARESR